MIKRLSNIFGALTDNLDKFLPNSFRGLVRAPPPCPPQEQGLLLPEEIPVELFSGPLREFLVRAPGRLLNKPLLNYFGNHFGQGFGGI